jgi:uncharacterized protein (TIGR02452 family)
MSEWDHNKWLEEYQRAKDNGLGFHSLRADVFENTVEIVHAGQYRTGDRVIELENGGKLIDETVLYTKPPVHQPKANSELTKFEVIQRDCLVVAEMLLQEGYNPAVLNMANRQVPGGGVAGGAGAQEENLFRRSNLFVSLFQYVDFGSGYGIKRNKSSSYPLDRNTGGVYSHGVTIFRSSERKGYALLEEPFKSAIVTVPAISHPELITTETGELQIAKHLVEPTKEKIRTILRIALAHGHDSLIPGAFGCGAFLNPPGHMAQLFREVFNEDEFSNSFRKVVFAIIDDHNARKSHNPHGNFEPFRKMFEQY